MAILTGEVTHPAAAGERPSSVSHPVPDRTGRTGPALLSIIVPTYREAANVAAVVDALDRALPGIGWEVIFVDDDSPDGTAARVRELAAADPRIRCLRRVGRRGLASACVEGMLASTAPYLAVMDADLQHDEALLPVMLDLLRRDEAELVIGSRYLFTDEVAGWNRRRHGMSRLATRLANTILPTGVTDPMSGFFMLRRELLDAAVHRLSNLGFKILLDLLASLPTPPRVRELPYAFRNRQHGESKLDHRAGSDFLLLLVDKRIGHLVPARFILFAAVGSIGVLVHMAALWLAFRAGGLPFAPSQALAALIALTGNYALNNELTYSDRRLRGWGWLRGWASFAMVCGIGALANVGVAAELYRQGLVWPAAALAGILVGAVWNYAMSAVSTWQPKPAR